MYNGWTKSIPEKEQVVNEIASCLNALAENPNNQWYANRLEELRQRKDRLEQEEMDAKEQRRQAEEIDADTEWLTALAYGDADLTPKIVKGTSSPEWWDAQEERSL